jgi:uncharacterized protein YgiM (DUF1202 family)
MIAASSANIRSDSSTSSEVLAKLGRGEKTALLWKEGEWYLLEIDKGWLAYAHESVLSPVLVAGKGPATASRTLTVAVEVGRVRQEPSVDSAIVSRLKRGESVSFSRTVNDWHQVALPDGRTGWAHKGLFVQN